MSYVIHLWEHEAPQSMAQALQLHERLLESAGPPPTARFAALLARLVRRFPAEVGGVEADEPTWVEPAPPRVDTEGAVLSLALYGEGPRRLLPVLIDEADALGLTVLDDQAGCLYLPGRRQLDMDGISDRPAAAEQPATEPERLIPRKIAARIRSQLQGPLARHGFELVEGSSTGSEFRRKTPAGLQSIQIHRAQEVWQHFFCCSLKPTLPPALAAVVALAPDIRLYVPVHAALQRFQRFDVSGYFDAFAASTPAELDSLLAAFLASIESQCLSALDACVTVEGLLEFDEKAGASGVHLDDSIVLLALSHVTGREEMATTIQRQLAKSNYDRGRNRILNLIATRLAVLPRSVS
ncbi:hypothetical protein LJR066_002705 [Acidovorax sp. LjRoot66]|uniref:hypothetical protein n=1 Tax=Acidovorax sp. LjRoot66 TaxID=3342334 RepID=UPI003ECFBD1E